MTAKKCAVCVERPLHGSWFNGTICVECLNDYYKAEKSMKHTVQWAATRARRYERARQKRSGR